MKINLPIKPLSINAAFQGRRFKTEECNQYCRELAVLLPKNIQIPGLVAVNLNFFLKNWKMTDGDNLVKVLMDCIVQAGIIEDDRKIMRYVIQKFSSEQDKIEIEITQWLAAPSGKVIVKQATT